MDARRGHQLVESGGWGERDGQAPIYAPRTLSRAYVDGNIVPAEITEPEDTGKSSLLLRNEAATYDRFEVEACTLDRIFAGRPGGTRARSFFLWIDVEGAADKVLAGAKSVLRETEAILVEAAESRVPAQSETGRRHPRPALAQGLRAPRPDREYGDLQFNMLLVRVGSLRRLAASLFDRSSVLRACLPDLPVVGREPATHRRYATVRSRLQADVPVFVPCYNNPTYARGMLAQLRRLGFVKILLVDNASTSPDMRTWLQCLNGEADVIALTENLGPRDIFLDPRRNLALLPRHFCVNRPRPGVQPELPEGSPAISPLSPHSTKSVRRALRLRHSERGAMRDECFRIGEREWKIWEWEAQFWKEPLPSLPGGDPVYNASIDTTFALYDRDHFDPARHARGVRVAGRFTARRLSLVP